MPADRDSPTASPDAKATTTSETTLNHRPGMATSASSCADQHGNQQRPQNQPPSQHSRLLFMPEFDALAATRYPLKPPKRRSRAE